MSTEVLVALVTASGIVSAALVAGLFSLWNTKTIRRVDAIEAAEHNCHDVIADIYHWLVTEGQTPNRELELRIVNLLH